MISPGDHLKVLLRSSRRVDALRQSGDLLLYVAAGAAAFFGLAARLALLISSGNREVGSFSGVGDQIRYLTLAESVFEGRGLTYAGQPTALRPPLYPLLLAGFHVVFGSHYLVAMRIFQFLAGIAVAFVCSLLGSKLFGRVAGTMVGALALALPTLVFINTELQTEALSAFLIILFWLFLIGEAGEQKRAAGIGITSGLAALLRFNCAILPVIGAIACLWLRRSVKNAVVVSLVAGLLITPWIVRNARVFHGRILFSSHGGINLLEGVLTPDGRAQGGESEKTRSVLGWLHTDIEQNSAHRLLFPSEDQLDQQARAAGISVWRDLSWRSRLRLLTGKVVTFWLSTDQLLETSSFSRKQRILRVLGVIAYWAVLVLSLVGWRSLLSTSKVSAMMIGFYAAFVTLAHLPFVMNTRLRIPFIDPLLAVLAGGGIWHLLQSYRRLMNAKVSTYSTLGDTSVRGHGPCC